MFESIEPKRWDFLLLMLGVIISFPQSAYAHRVAIAGWVEDNKVVTQSVFSGGAKPKEATIKVFKPNGDLMIEGKTDSDGYFSFVPEEQVDLKLVLYAGTGHQATFAIPASELMEIDMELAQSGSSKSAAAENLKQVKVAEDENAIECFDQKGLNELIKQRINEISKQDKKPVLDDGPSLASILSGLGYIIGLIGFASYFNYRRKLKELSSLHKSS